MAIRIEEVTDKAGQKKFVNFQFDLYKNNKFWVPPVKDDEIKALNKETNPVFKYVQAKLWLACDGDKVVGRIAAIVNEAYNEKVGKNIGRFSRMEFVNNIEVAKALLDTAENWLRDQGMVEVQGPLGFSNLDTQGMLVEGFDYLPSIGSVYHHDYYKDILPQCGYEKEIDWIEFRLTLGEQAVTKADRGSKLIQRRYGIEVMNFEDKDALRPHAQTIFRILNDAFSDLPYVTAFSEDLIEFYAEKYMKFLNPKFVKMVKMNDEIIGFVIGIPSLSEAMQKAKGKLFPFGFVHLKKAIDGNVDTLDQMLTGVKKEHMSTGAGVILMAELQNEMVRHNMKYIETTGIFETNQNAISNWKNYDHIQHKRKRCWRKTL